MERIKIITDSAADIPAELAQKYNITVLPLCVVIDGKVYYEGRDFTPREYYKRMSELKEIPTTSMVPAEMLRQEFEKNLTEYDKQIYITISAKSSGGYQAAHLMKTQLEEETGKPSNITILDSKSFTMVYGRIVIKMAQMAADGCSYDEIINFFNTEMPKSTAFFMVDDLIHLKKGGRINPGVAILGTLLNIKPILTINDGLVDAYKKERGKNRALENMVNYAIEQMSDPSENEIWIANGYAEEDCAVVTEKLKAKITPKSISHCEIGCVIGTHAGPGLVGIIFSK